jgi:hypothetical protein
MMETRKLAAILCSDASVMAGLLAPTRITFWRGCGRCKATLSAPPSPSITGMVKRIGDGSIELASAIDAEMATWEWDRRSMTTPILLGLGR